METVTTRALPARSLRPQHARKYARERTDISIDGVGDHGQLEGRKAGGVAVGVDDKAPTCGARRQTTWASIGLPLRSSRPLSPPPMRRERPPASTTPVTSNRPLISPPRRPAPVGAEAIDHEVFVKRGSLGNPQTLHHSEAGSVYEGERLVLQRFAHCHACRDRSRSFARAWQQVVRALPAPWPRLSGSAPRPLQKIAAAVRSRLWPRAGSRT